MEVDIYNTHTIPLYPYASETKDRTLRYAPPIDRLLETSQNTDDVGMMTC